MNVFYIEFKTFTYQRSNPILNSKTQSSIGRITTSIEGRWKRKRSRKLKLSKIRKALIHTIVYLSDKGYNFQQIAMITQIPEDELRWMAFQYMYSRRELHMRNISTSYQFLENYYNRMLADPKLSAKYMKGYKKVLRDVSQSRKDLGPATNSTNDKSQSPFFQNTSLYTLKKKFVVI